MKEELNFVCEDGEIKDKDITIYALSTCGFCRKGLKFLRDNSIKFKYVYFDELDQNTKVKLENYLESRYTKRLSFPYVVVNDESCIAGFNEDVWEKNFLKK